VAVLSDVTAADIDLSVWFKPISGRVDQAAGLVWRYQNQDNYYIVRANALEDNVVLYKVEGGKRTDLPVKGEGRTYGKKSEVPSGQWSTLRVVANGRLFEVYFNGTKLYEVDDATFSKPGKVGVWTKADSITVDDLTVDQVRDDFNAPPHSNFCAITLALVAVVGCRSSYRRRTKTVR
jgi:hypothetical protein